MTPMTPMTPMTLAALLDPDRVFSLAGTLAMLGWLALAVSPAGARWAPAARRFAGLFVPLLLAVGYVVLFGRAGMGDGGYESLAAVGRLLADPGRLAAGWLHYLAFDLFVGAWIAGRAAEHGIAHWLLLPILALTFLFGPAGLLAYAALRLAMAARNPVPARSTR
ncbi:MAG: ABA4-like family protein [Lautropia sp.]